MADLYEIIKSRGSLACFKKAIQAKKVRMGFIGGSITEANREYNWPYFVKGWFVKKFPEVRYVWENAAIGGTGSLSAIMRAQKDLIEPQRYCLCRICSKRWTRRRNDENARRTG